MRERRLVTLNHFRHLPDQNGYLAHVLQDMVGIALTADMLHHSVLEEDDDTPSLILYDHRSGRRFKRGGIPFEPGTACKGQHVEHGFNAIFIK